MTGNETAINRKGNSDRERERERKTAGGRAAKRARSEIV